MLWLTQHDMPAGVKFVPIGQADDSSSAIQHSRAHLDCLIITATQQQCPVVACGQAVDGCPVLQQVASQHTARPPGGVAAHTSTGAASYWALHAT